MKKRLLSALLCGIMAVSMCAGCGSKEEATTEGETNVVEASIATKITEPVEISFWHAMSGVNEEALQKIVADFEEKNPNITVNLENQGDYLTLFDKLMASAKADQLPTMTQIYSNRLVWYVSKGLVTDLTPYMEDAVTGFTEEDYEDIPEMFFTGGMWDGKEYAMPFNKSQMVLYYNEEMLEAAGVEVPTTWEEWEEACEKLTVDEDGDGEPEIYGCVFANNLSTDIAPWVRQAGGQEMDDETGELYFDSAEMKEAVEFLSGLMQKKVARLAGDDSSANVPVQDGRAAMCVASTSALPYIEAGTVEGITINAAALPGYVTNDQLYYGTNVAIFNTATEDEQQAAWEFITYLINTQNTAYFAAQTGYIPVRKSAVDDPVFAAVLEEKPIKQLSFDCMDDGFQGARPIGAINALDELGIQLELVFAGEKTVDEALADAQANGEQAIIEARSN